MKFLPVMLFAITSTFALAASADAGPLCRVAKKDRSMRPMESVSQRIADRPKLARKAWGRVKSVRVLPRNR